MRKSYKKLIIFEIIVFSFLLLNSFFPKLLHGYYFIFFLLILLLIVKILFGFERTNKRYTKNLLLYLLLIIISFLILFYVVGIFVGFTKSANYFSKYGIINFIIPAVISIIIKEVIRYNLIKKIDNSKILFVLTIIVFVMLDLVNVINMNSFYSFYNSFLITSLYILPSVAKNILCSYISNKSGYLLPIIYLLIMNCYIYFIPIIPNINNYIYSLISILFPIFLFLFMYSLFSKEKDEFIYQNSLKTNYISLVIVAIIVIPIIYLSCGYFRYFSLVIGSGSMEPSIHTGNAVIVDTKDKDIEIGDVIAYNYSGRIVVHRLNKIVETKSGTYYYTKGDANKSVDNWVVKSDMIIGTVKVNIPYVGLPVVWINNL